MLTVDELVRLENGEAVSRTVFPLDSPFMGSDVFLDEAVFFEMMAQTFAAVYAFLNNEHKPSSGYLVGVKRLNIAGRAQAGQAVEVRVRIISTVDDFSVVEGQATQDGQTLAHGQITIFVPKDGQP